MQTRRCFALLLLCTSVTLAWASAGPAVFDVHLHYNAEDARAFTPREIVAILERNAVPRAVVTSTPPDHAERLYHYAPERIVPFLGVYRSRSEKDTWFADETLPARVEAELARGPWRGVGELHLFAEQRHSPVFRRLVEVAAERRLVLLVHADPAVIDRLFEIAPAATVIWAHAGAYPYPPLLGDYLDRYPQLYIDLSVRERQIAPEGRLDTQWELLLLERTERFLVGVDTFSTRRWRHFDAVTEEIRGWLAQLPPEVAAQIASGNAERLFPPSDAAAP